MRHLQHIFLSILAAGALLCSCEEHYIEYSDAEYIMFADTLRAYAVVQDGGEISVPVVSTVTCDYDRVIAVEVIDSESSAIEGLHYTLESNTLTIPAGSNRADLKIRGRFDSMENGEDLDICLNLLMNDRLSWDLYGTRTKVRLVKVCPFNIENFCGWCVLSSTFLQTYNPYGSYQRLVHTKAHPTRPDCIICENWMLDGYDIVLRFDTSDPLNPTVEPDGEQIISDEGSFFGMNHGDGRIRAIGSSLYDSYYNTCGSYLFVWTAMYVKNLDTMIGTVGHFYNVMEWISDEEAERLRNEGM